MAEEGGRRSVKGKCLTEKGKDITFSPIIFVSTEWEKWFINQHKISLCDLYYPPYNFARTGCKGCPFAIKLQEELDTLEKYFPAEKRQCEWIWKPVYDEYRRIGYRLRKEDPQMDIWEFIGEENGRDQVD